MKPLKDTDLMPFGPFKGKEMQYVSAPHLYWLWTSGLSGDVATSPVAAYIYNNLEGLKQEFPSKGWD